MPKSSQLTPLEARALGMAVVSFLGEIPEEHRAEIEAPLLAVIAKLGLQPAIAELTQTLKATAETWKPQCCALFDPFGETPIHAPGCPNA